MSLQQKSMTPLQVQLLVLVVQMLQITGRGQAEVHAEEVAGGAELPAALAQLQVDEDVGG